MSEGQQDEPAGSLQTSRQSAPPEFRQPGPSFLQKYAKYIAGGLFLFFTSATMAWSELHSGISCYRGHCIDRADAPGLFLFQIMPEVVLSVLIPLCAIVFCVLRWQRVLRDRRGPTEQDRDPATRKEALHAMEPHQTTD